MAKCCACFFIYKAKQLIFRCLPHPPPEKLTKFNFFFPLLPSDFELKKSHSSSCSAPNSEAEGVLYQNEKNKNQIQI